MSYPELDAARANWRWQPAADALAGRVILITGAGDGIGRAAARTCATYGADVVLLGRTRAKLEAVFDEIAAATDTQPVIVPADLLYLDETNVDALRQSIEDGFGRLDGLLHNASMLGLMTPLAAYPASTWREVFQVNVHAAALLTGGLMPLLEASTDASVVFTSSSVGRQGRAFWGAYAASKFATEGLMQTFADEVDSRDNVRANSLNPGATRTTMRAQAYPGENPADVVTPESRMDIYLYLLSGASTAHNGQAFDARDWTP
ncbi:MAG: YciK family oxidoreductase [Pseudomonadota bacterium]